MPHASPGSSRSLRMRRVALALAAAALALVVGGGAAEIALRTVYDPVLVLDGDPMWERRWRAARENRPGDSGPATGYAIDRHDPLLGWSPRPHLDADGVRTNSLGIRADREIPFERAPGVRRIVLLGDSFTWGEEVANEETFGARLETRLQGVEVVNLGVHGYGTDQQLLRYRELGTRFEPDLVLLGFYRDDLFRNALSFRDYAKPRFRVIGGEPVLEGVPVPRPEEILAAEEHLPVSFLWVVARRLLTKNARRLGAGLERSEEWRVTRAILEMLDEDCRADGARLALIYMPFDTYREDGPVRPLLAHWSAESGVPLLDLRERFLELPEDDQRRLYDGHWTPFGNDVVARLVAEFVAERALLEDAHADAGAAHR